MNTRRLGVLVVVAGLALAAACANATAVAAAETVSWQAQHDQLVARLRALAGKEGAFGPAYQPIYHAALTWYEQWGGNPQHSVDDWMVPPEQYASELADALEHGRNFFAENPGALWPLCFEARLATGKTVRANYWLSLPAGFPTAGRSFPLVIGLHGSGWLGHKLSFVRKARKDAAGGRAFAVTPIDEAGPWQIDFLNAYLDELLRILPIDPDHVYVEGHSLGAMATWEWAMNNPERFAGISPRSGRGEPFRAVRLLNIPAWVIHGENDDVIPTGFADQMVTAMQATGGRVKYSVLAGVPHNMPDDLDENLVVDWYLQQTRSHAPPPPDPLAALGINTAGFSAWEMVSVPAASYWSSEPVLRADRDAMGRAMVVLFRKVRDFHERADAPLQQKTDRSANNVTLWLRVPRTLRSGTRADATAVTLPAAKFVRFYFRGETQAALAHLEKLTAEVETAGHHLTDELWITPLTLWPDTATGVAEYRVGVK
jgi:hypothetical protein